MLMARLPRLAVAGLPHHVIQRGHHQQPIVLDDEDRRLFLQTLRESSLAAGVSIHAYVLLDDHVHLLATPREASGLGIMMQALGRRYVAAFNRRHGRRGTLWEGRFRATVIEPERFLLPCMSYIELHPVRHGAVAQPEQYPWSSSAHHYGLRADPMVSDHKLFWALGNTPFDREARYRAVLAQGLSSLQVKDITHATQKGWALGSATFLAGLAAQTPRRVAAKARGRPRRASLDVSPIKRSVKDGAN
jgi:putative transposase